MNLELKNYAMKFKLIGLLILAMSSQLNAQDQYFKETLKELTSKSYHGRGYTHDGMQKAANYLKAEFKKLGLQSLGTDYGQTHTFPINVIEDAKLVLNGKQLEYGKDFIVKPSSQSVKMKEQRSNYILDTEAFVESFESKKQTIAFIAKDEKERKDKNIILPVLKTKVDSIQRYYKTWANSYENHPNNVVFRFVADSLTASLSQRQANVTEFIIKEKHFSKDLRIEDYQVQAKWNEKFAFENVIGAIEGKNNDSIVVISAHYDHLGQVGQAIFPGASDNGSGTAMVLSLAKYYAQHQPKYKTVFMLFGAEEAGIVGSYNYVENPLFPLGQIKFMVNLDIMGAGEDGIQVVNGTKFRQEFDRLAGINQENGYLKTVKIRGESCNSDHCPFDQKGVPSFFIYTLGGKGNYHNIYDTYENLDLSSSDRVRKLLLNFIDGL